IADFYNSIIGHYEVPLDHPKRDKTRGRIWRITYKGKEHGKANLITAPLDELVAALDHDNLVVRFAAANQLVQRFGGPAVEAVTTLINDEDVSARAYSHGLWVLHRLDALSDDLIQSSASHEDPLIRLHTMRILLERTPASDLYFNVVSQALNDQNPHVERAATETLAKMPDMRALEKALEERNSVPDEDSHQL